MSALSDAATLAARFINNTQRHVFLTGKAGTGKTTFLRYITQHTHKTAVIAAPTGVAAINAGGVTLHSLFQLPFGAYVPENRLPDHQGNLHLNTRDSLIRGLQIRGNKRRLLQELELLIIDEVSMLRADLLDAINAVLQVVRRRGREPFGGVQVLFIGDLLQLPPVVKENEWQVLKQYYRSPFFFDAQCLQEEQKPLLIELDKVYRQQDDTFITLLNHLRHNQLLPQDVALLNEHYRPGFRSTPEDPYIQLTTHNSQADNINRDALRKLPGKSYFYKAEIQDDFPETAFPIEETLELKQDAQVMFLKNDMSGEKRFFNGKIGRVVKLDASGFEVAFENEPGTVKVEKHVWYNVRYRYNEASNEVEPEELGTFTHYPIRLAWAITVHKSQGLTFRKAILDLGSAFAPGQVYVALSRLTSLDGLVLCSPIPNRLPEQDRSLAGFTDAQVGQPLTEIFQHEAQAFLKSSLKVCFDFTQAGQQVKSHLYTYAQEEHHAARQKWQPWAQQLQEEFNQLRTVADKFLPQLDRLTHAPIDSEQLETRVQSASQYFLPVLEKLDKNVLQHAQQVGLEKKTKKYYAELLELESHLHRLLQNLRKAPALVSSFKEGTELTKEAYSHDEADRQELRQPAKPAKKEAKEKTEGVKKEKGQTQAESFQLYRQGLSIEEISKARSLAVTTIEGHLARYVTSGEIAVEKFVNPKKVEQIITAASTLESPQLSAVKQLLGDEFSYTEIRFAMAEKARRE